MGRRRRENEVRISSSSPTHSLSSSSSSDFEFRVSSSPNNCNKSSSHVDIDLCPADDLFYKGQLLPLHLSPRLSMVRTLLLASSTSTTSSSSPRDSTGSSNDSTASSSLYGDLVLLPDGPHQYCDSSRQSSVTEDDHVGKSYVVTTYNTCQHKKYSNRYFSSLAKFSSVFRRDHHNKIKEQQQHEQNVVEDRSNCSVKRVSASAKEVIRKYLNKVKPFCDKLSNHHKQEEKIEMKTTTTTTTTTMEKRSGTTILNPSGGNGGDHVRFSHSFSGNIVMYPQRRRCVSSCPSSMRSSPSHSQCSILHRNVNNNRPAAVTESLSSRRVINGGITSNSSSMEELQSAIQGAITHCKNSMIQKNNGSVMSKEI
ncbi:hypothetical protein Sjap_007883 [Stephania japonica]|uniref:Membrane-associated kinase regulator 1 n=1 Tax=Stephania japonica TaxID=461633 RepID=A0AAP0PBR6_9MAGN